ncbi:uncharacterized protein DFL_005178 [Arthrobotrys flagrans]|uniref:Uncharacterized protein n=1 Tax=Arthrobotrys flagrans TaxID=97331 RepID=A0A437A7D7_ARTFL|nr:hypothetical protein DFL_005178 [Arthrobotrys flagrans]
MEFQSSWSPKEPPSKGPTTAENPTASSHTSPPKFFRDKKAPGVKYLEDTLLEDIWLQTVYRKYAKSNWLWELQGYNIRTIGDLECFDGKGGMERLKKRIKLFFEEELGIEYEKEWKKQVKLLNSDDFKNTLNKSRKTPFHYGFQELEEEEKEEEDEDEGTMPHGTTSGKRKAGMMIHPHAFKIPTTNPVKDSKKSFLYPKGGGSADADHLH